MSDELTTGQRLKRAREAKGLGLRQAAEMAGVFHPTLAAVESGRKSAGLEWLHRVCVALGVDPHRVDERLANTRRRENAPPEKKSTVVP